LKMSSKTSTTPPQVVIIGAGYAGALVARSLEADCKANKIAVTVVERRESVHHKIGAIRASVRAGEWTDRVRIPLSRVIKHARTVIGDVVQVDNNEKVVRFRDDSVPPLKYDILVCATGTLNHSPGDLPPHLSGKDEVRAYFRTTAQAIKDAKDVLIVGGGASACEYAGEVSSDTTSNAND
jgi:apoptosis-inducing factor 2